MLTLEHDWPPGLSPRDITTGEIQTHTTKQAQMFGNDVDELRFELGHWARDAGHYLVKVLQKPENTWAARFLISRGFDAKQAQEILEDHLTGRPKERFVGGMYPAGHQMWKAALRVTVSRDRYPIDISEIIAGTFLSKSPIVKDMVLDVQADQRELLHGLLINPSRG